MVGRLLRDARARLEEVEDDGEPFDEKMERLTDELGRLFTESRKLEEQIREQLGDIGYGI